MFAWNEVCAIITSNKLKPTNEYKLIQLYGSFQLFISFPIIEKMNHIEKKSVDIITIFFYFYSFPASTNLVVDLDSLLALAALEDF